MSIHRRIRAASAIAIASAAGMTVLGALWTGLREAPLLFVSYWSVVVILLAVAVYLAFLDMRFVRLRYSVQERQALRDAFGFSGKDPSAQTESDTPPPAQREDSEN